MTENALNGHGPGAGEGARGRGARHGMAATRRGLSMLHIDTHIIIMLPINKLSTYLTALNKYVRYTTIIISFADNLNKKR